jgi:GNAT superfamily N-acetyltransferase
MLKITKVSIECIPEIKRLSDEIWKQVYPSVVPMAQIEFLLNTWYSTAALTEQMEQSGHQFILVEWNDEAVGYASYSMKLANQPERFRVHKLYLQPAMHGKGIGRAMLKYIAAESMPQGCKELELNVHKRNPAVGFYQHVGFTIEQDIVTVIEHGHVLDDYIMTLDLTKNPL